VCETILPGPIVRLLVERDTLRQGVDEGRTCMARLRVGIIGTGRRKERADARGYGMAYDHAAAYQALPGACALVACADIVRENAEAFANATGIPVEGVFTDYRAMLAEAHLDVVSICT